MATRREKLKLRRFCGLPGPLRMCIGAGAFSGECTDGYTSGCADGCTMFCGALSDGCTKGGSNTLSGTLACALSDVLTGAPSVKLPGIRGKHASVVTWSSSNVLIGTLPGVLVGACSV